MALVGDGQLILLIFSLLWSTGRALSSLTLITCHANLPCPPLRPLKLNRLVNTSKPIPYHHPSTGSNHVLTPSMKNRPNQRVAGVELPNVYQEIGANNVCKL